MAPRRWLGSKRLVRWWRWVIGPWNAWKVRWRRARTLGARGEKAAERYLVQLGYTIVARNERDRLGELDLIAVDGRTVVFVEVKTLASDNYKQPSEAVDAAKRTRLIGAARRYVQKHSLAAYDTRFDIVSIVWPAGKPPRIEHIQRAFVETTRREPNQVA